MVTKDQHHYVIYPIYFDKKLSRKQGRKVAKKHAVEKPTVDAITKAAKSLHLNPQKEQDTRHPATHLKHKGRILVDQKEPKTTLLRQIAQRL